MNQPDSSPENLLKEIESLRQKLAAKEKTIAVLTKRVLEKQTQRTSDFSLLEENFSLQGVVTRKTVELEEQNNKLEEAHRALKQAQSELLQAQKLESIGRLAAGIAHEINTPVQYIADNIYFIQDTFGKVVALEKLTREIIDRSLAQNKTCLHAKGLKEEFEKLGINFAIAEIPKAIEDAIEGTQRVSRKGLLAIGGCAETLAACEGLDAHHAHTDRRVFQLGAQHRPA